MDFEFTFRLPLNLKYFTNRSINAAAESFNEKIRALRGVRKPELFLYLLEKLYPSLLKNSKMYKLKKSFLNQEKPLIDLLLNLKQVSDLSQTTQLKCKRKKTPLVEELFWL